MSTKCTQRPPTNLVTCGTTDKAANGEQESWGSPTPGGAVPSTGSYRTPHAEHRSGKQTSSHLRLSELFPKVHSNNIFETYSIPCLELENQKQRSQKLSASDRLHAVRRPLKCAVEANTFAAVKSNHWVLHVSCPGINATFRGLHWYNIRLNKWYSFGSSLNK